MNVSDEHPKRASVTLGGDDFEGAVEQLSRVFGRFDGRPTGRTSEFAWSTSLHSASGLVLVSGHYEGEWDLWPVDDTPEMLSILRCHQGATQTSFRGSTVESTAGSLLLANNLEAGRYALRGDRIVSDALFVDWEIIARNAASLFDQPLKGSLNIAPEIALSDSSAAWMAGLMDTIADGMRANGPLLHSPLAAAHMAEALSNLILLNVPNHFTQFIDRKPAAVAPRQVKQAIDYMHKHIARPITVQAIAQAIGVSSRSLEISFRSFKGVTPAAYLRDIRLKAAHAELCDPASSLTIREICLKWGFFHIGRFSAVYRDAYGVSPSESRRRFNKSQV